MRIGLSGKMGVGKSSIAANLSAIFDDWGMMFARVSFAALLKAEAAKVYGYPESWGNSNKDAVVLLPGGAPRARAWKRGRATVREILQFYGTEVTRERDPDYWVKAFEERTRNFPGQCVVIVDDVRFPNEKEFIEKKGVCFRIEPYDGYCYISDHPSEIALDNAVFQYRIKPDFGEGNLRDAAMEIANIVRERLDD